MVIGAVVSKGGLVLWKIILYGSSIIIVIILLQSIIQMNKEKSLRPVITGIGERIVATDSYLYDSMKKLEQNPGQLYYDFKYVEAQKSFGADQTRLQLEYQKLNSHYEKFKFYLFKSWTYIDLFLSIWFLFTIFYVFYWIGGRIFIGHADNVWGATMIAILIFSSINIIFTFMLYDYKIHDNKNFSQLSLSEQGYQLLPVKGIIELGKNIPFLIGTAYDKIVMPIENAKDKPGIEGVAGKVLG